MAEFARRVCGTMDVHRRLLNTDREYALRRASIENLARLYRRGARRSLRTEVVRIPVVVHVLHNTPEQNVSDAQIRSQIAALNRDYRAQAEGIPALPPAFRVLAADARVEFVLADATRTATSISAFPLDESVKSRDRGGADPRPRDQFLNIWVCPLAGGVLGYAQLPGGPAATDGVVITSTAFGTTGTAAAPFNLGRTATHEVGHWLNLLHIWGDDDTGCNGSDFVDDTPNQAGPNYGIPSFPHLSCDNGPNGDLFVNFMDYTDDAGMQLFTPGQVTRIDATLDGPRAALLGKEPVPMDPVDPSRPEPAGATSLLFYDRAAGAAEVFALDSDGGISLTGRHEGWRTTWDAIAAAGRHLLFYNRAAGAAEVYAVDGQGGLSLTGRHEGWRTNWDAVAGAGSSLLFYDRTAGAAEVYALDGEGGLTLTRRHEGWRTSWTAIVAGPIAGVAARRAAGVRFLLGRLNPVPPPLPRHPLAAVALPR